MLRIVLREHVLPQALKLSDKRLQFRLFGQQCRLGFTEHLYRRLSHTNRVITTLGKQQRLALQLLPFEFAVARGYFRLHLKTIHLRGQLGLNIADPRQIFFGVRQAIFGVLTSFLVARHAGRFFQKHAQLFGLGLDDARDHALLNHRISSRPEASAKEHVKNIAPTNRLIVQVVAGADIPLHDALDGELGVLAPLTSCTTAAVIEHQLDARARNRFAIATTIENDVIHRFAT